MSARPWLDRPCPTCGSESGKPCRALTSGRSTDTHAARWQTTHPHNPPAPGQREDG